MEIELEPTELVTETLPAVLTGAEITEARLQEIEGWKNYTISDPLDKAGAKEADRLRLLAKADRCTAVRICDGEREEVMRQNQWWIATKKRVVERIEPVEEHLQGIVDAHKNAILDRDRLEILEAIFPGWRAEEESYGRAPLHTLSEENFQVAVSHCREAKAAKEREKTQCRLDILTARGIAPDLTACALPDEEWDTWLQAQTDALAVRRRAQEIADELTSLGDPCVYVEALALTEDELVQRLEAAKAAHLRREAAHTLAAELTALGDDCSIEEALQIPEDGIAQRLADARADKERRDQEERADLGKRRLESVIDEDPEILLDGRPMPEAADLAAMSMAAWEAHLAGVRREVEERGRRRLHLGADRMAVLSGLGMESIPTQRDLSLLTEDHFEVIRSMAAEAKDRRDQIAREERDELERLRKERADRGKLRARLVGDAVRDVPASANLQSWSEDYLAALPEGGFQELLESVRQSAADARETERVRLETIQREATEREERLKPEREKLATWARDFQRAIPGIPEVSDPQLVSLLARTTTTIETALRLMRGALEGTP